VRSLFQGAGHADAGEVLLFAGRDGERMWNFLWEYGCHGSWESEEQDAFLIQSSYLGPSASPVRSVPSLDMHHFFERRYVLGSLSLA
jgi:hypothetical protein